MSERRLQTAFALVAVVTSAVIAIFTIGLPIYVYPVVDKPAKVDAVLVLGPSVEPRRRIANDELINAGLSNNLVISVPASGGRSAEEFAPCNVARQGVHVFCMHSEPFTTLGEADAFARLAEQHGWSSVAVVSATPHLIRAQLLVERCYDGEILMLGDKSGLTLSKLAWQYVYQTVAFLKAALVTTECPVSESTVREYTLTPAANPAA